MSSITEGSLAEIVRADPLLTLYCRCGSQPDALPFPELTRPERLAELTARGDRVTVATLLADILRPPALAFRVLLDRYGVLLPPPSRLSLCRTPGVGTLVLDASAVAEVAEESAARARLAEFTATADAVGAAAAAGLGADPATVRAEVTGILRAQWRFLDTAGGLLGHTDLTHSVPRAQHAVLTEVLNRVGDRARYRRRDPTARPPAVMLDLDLCALVPRRRTLEALRLVADRFGIDEFRQPETLPRLPTYHRPAWDRYAERTGLWRRHPMVDRDAVFDAFWHEFFTPWDRMRSDEPAPGLRRFVWDVYDAGGCVVFNTGRRERVRTHTEAALARAGITHPRLVMAPDNRTRPVSEHKAENLRHLADVDIVAVFDDLCDNRRLIAKQLPEATMVSVALPGFATECDEDGAPDDDAAVVNTFETVPRLGYTATRRDRLTLSHTRSLAELAIGELADHGAAGAARAVHLDTAASTALVDTLLAHSDIAAARLAEHATRALPGADPVTLIHYVLTRERFRKGPRGNYPLPRARRDLATVVRRGEPVPVVTFGFPLKLHYNGLKTTGTRPDLAEVGALVRLRELQHAVRAVYPPGLDLTVLTDGNHFQPRPAALLAAYRTKLAEYHQLMGGARICQLADVEEVAARRLGADIRDRRQALIDTGRDRIDTALSGLDVRDGPLHALAAASERCQALLGPRGDGTAMPGFGDLFRSLMYVVPLVPPDGRTLTTWARLVYADLFHLTDPEVPATVLHSRRDVLAAAWQRTVRYLAVLGADRALGYDDATLFPGRIRLTPNPRPGALGFTYLAGTGVLAWHGTGALDGRARLSTDFAAALSDRGYVPVYSPLLGTDQPWFMVPSTMARDGRLDTTATDHIHLRRR